MKPLSSADTALLARFARNFPGSTCANGTIYAFDGKVQIDHADDRRVVARVRGTLVYKVEIALNGDEVNASCSCPRYNDGFFCKHLWAVLVVATSNGHLGGLATATPTWIHAIDPEEDDVLDMDDLPPNGRMPDLAALMSQPPILKPPPAPSWRDAFQLLKEAAVRFSPGRYRAISERVHFVMDAEEIKTTERYILRLFTRTARRDGSRSEPKPLHIWPREIDSLNDPEDRRLVASLFGGAAGFHHPYQTNQFELTSPLLPDLLPGLCRTGRFHLHVKSGPMWDAPCTWDDTGTWEVRLRLVREGNASVLSGSLDREGGHMDMSEPDLLLAAGILFARNRAARFRFAGDFGWISFLRQYGPLRIPRADEGGFLSALYRLPGETAIELPEDLRPREVRVKPRPRIRFFTSKDRRYRGSRELLLATCSFAYEGTVVAASDECPRFYEKRERLLVIRDAAAEDQALHLLTELGLRWIPAYDRPRDAEYELYESRFPSVVAELVARDWQVEAEEGTYRKPGTVRISVASGIDWFDMQGGVEYGGELVPFPRLLQAIRSGQRVVRLGDGSFGLLPEEWLRRNGLALGAGEIQGDALRYRPGQAMLFDALLAAEGAATFDEGFKKLRDRIRSFERVEPQDPPAGFRGTLRPYQRLGLGWLGFLREYGLGGCLADDMGLGKTVQLLAYLASRRSGKGGASLVVVPRSLLFNWKEEARRFTPDLRVIEHVGGGRVSRAEGFDGADLVLTTYGTLRRDAPFLKDVRFDCVVLDESQAIKNAGSATAKAARLLKGEQRLAMSGTPIENHLGELWSLMEFLNPGLLGTAPVFRDAIKARDGEDAPSRTLLARALRPFILRRTKEQVAPELPPRTEQTIQVELETGERRRYDELREHYRQSLLGRNGGRDWARAKIHVLEALLRLRQAACHPGMLDATLRGSASAKLDALMDRIREVIDEGHKALVFSQFTSFLGILRNVLDREEIPYAYLDGQTRDREACVGRFQTDPACRLFLISLKAGGFGLNLTAAEYVFLLDPWWNPAVEAQAIDRTHRIGQSRPVFAYRLVARDTVEEKVLKLQKSKRELADAILAADQSLLGDLTREELELLLS